MLSVGQCSLNNHQLMVGKRSPIYTHIYIYIHIFPPELKSVLRYFYIQYTTKSISHFVIADLLLTV